MVEEKQEGGAYFTPPPPGKIGLKLWRPAQAEFVSENIAIEWDMTKVVRQFFSPKHCGSWGMLTMCQWEYYQVKHLTSQETA